MSIASIVDKIAKAAENAPRVYEEGFAAGVKECNRSVVIHEGVGSFSNWPYSPDADTVSFNATSLESGYLNVREYGERNGFTFRIGKNVKCIPSRLCFSESGASRLKGILFEDGCACESIERNAFYFCHPLMDGELYVKGKNMVIGYGAFYGGYDSLTKIKLKGISEIANRAFAFHKKLLRIYFLDKPTTVNSEAFIGCGEDSRLLEIYVPWSEGEVANAPWGASNATIHYSYPTNIEYSVEYHEGSGNDYMIVEGEGAIPNFASKNEQIWYHFKDNVFDNIIIKDGITEIGDRAFAGFSYVYNIVLPASLKVIGTLAFDRLGTTPDSTYHGLDEVALPEGLEIINTRAFQNTGLETLTLPSTVQSIGICIAQSCPRLKTITFKGTPNHLDARAFEGCESITDIYVPWSEGEVANAPWGSTTATIHYNSEV